MTLTEQSRLGLAIVLLALAPSCGAQADRAGAPEPVQVREGAPADRELPQSGPLAVAAPAPPTAPGADGTALGVPDVAERAIKGVVNISTTRVTRRPDVMTPFDADPFFREFFGRRGPRKPLEQRQSSLGSGVLVSADGIVVTNNHVVEGATDIRVALSDGRELVAEIVGTDRKSDVALLKLKGGIKDLEPLPVGNSDKLRLGETVLAIGNPFGLGNTVTMGIVSAKGRANLGIVDYENFIQTDAAINPGNSGGALLNLKGELVGINTAIFSRSGGYQGIGFAIPSNTVMSIKDELLTKGKVTRGWLGIMIQDLRPELQEAMGLGDLKGVLVADVVPEGPAAKAGFHRGDVVLEIDGRRMTDASELRNFVASLGDKRKVDVVVHREGSRRTLAVTLGSLPDEAAEEEVAALSCDSKDGLGGLQVAPLDAQSRATFQVPDRVTQGLVVTGIQQGCSAAETGLHRGDVILEVNQVPVKKVEDLPKAWAQGGQTAIVVLLREGHTVFLPVPKNR